MRQWKCPHCGGWVDMIHVKHLHPVARQPALSDMIAARMTGREQDALRQQIDIHETLWMPEFERRDKPDE